MTDKNKKTFLFSTIIGSFAIYCFIYYAHVFKVAPYNFKEFKSFVFKYGTKDSMVNSYNSATGEYTYLNNKDSLVRKHLILTRAELDTLHKDASNLGLWDFPDREINNDTVNPGNKKVLRYFIQFNYKRKSKKALFDANFVGPVKLLDANKELISRIKAVLDNAEERQKK